MDVDFSQLGQNIAQTSIQQRDFATKNAEKQQPLEQKSVDLSARKDQEILVEVDTNGKAERESLNIETAVSEISDFIKSRNRLLDFSIDEKSERPVVKVTDSESGEVIRQIPSEEVLKLSERIKELQTDVGAVVGVLFNKQA